MPGSPLPLEAKVGMPAAGIRGSTGNSSSLMAASVVLVSWLRLTAPPPLLIADVGSTMIGVTSGCFSPATLL